MGADRAIHVEINGTDYDNLQPLAISKMLAAITQQEKVDLVLVGKQVCLIYTNNTWCYTCKLYCE